MDFLQAHPGDLDEVEKKAAQWPCRWHQHVRSWHTQTYVPMLVVRYEDLKRDTLVEVKRMTSFLGWDVTEEQLEEAIETSSIESMRKLEKSKKLQLNSVGQGIVGGAAQKYTAEEMECFLSYAGETLREFSYLE